MMMGQPNKTLLTRTKIHRAFGPFLVPYLKDENIIEISRNESDGWIWILNKAGYWRKEFAIEDAYATSLVQSIKKLITNTPPAVSSKKSTSEIAIVVDEYHIFCPAQTRRPVFTIQKNQKFTPIKKSNRQRRVVPTIPEHHDWMKDIRRVSLIYEFLLDEYFGVEFHSDQDEQDIINQEKIKKAEKIVSLMLERKANEKIQLKKLLRSKQLTNRP